MRKTLLALAVASALLGACSTADRTAESNDAPLRQDAPAGSDEDKNELDTVVVSDLERSEGAGAALSCSR